MRRPPHTICIRRDADTLGYVVEVLPPLEGVGHDRECRTHKEAYGYGAGLRMTLGCQLLDLTAEELRRSLKPFAEVLQ
jgi:hypothetical protein